MDPAIVTAIVQGIVQVATIIGTIWGLFNRQQKDIDTKIQKSMQRVETKLNMMRPTIIQKPPEDPHV